MRGVHLHDVEAGVERPRRSRGKARDHVVDVTDAHRSRHRICRRERSVGRPERLPAAGAGTNRRAALPRRRRAAFAARVCQLNAGDAPLRMDRADESGETVHVFVPVDTEIVRTDPSFGRDRSRFGEHNRGSADRAAGEMDKMPLVGKPVGAGVLAHRRHDDAVGEGEPAERERIEQVRHRIILYDLLS